MFWGLIDQSHRTEETSALLAKLNAMSAWKMNLLSCATALPNQLPLDPPQTFARLAEKVALPLAAELAKVSAAGRAWFWIILLESPAVRRRLRIYLLDMITAHGVYRDLSDLPETSGSSVGLLLAAALAWSGKNPEPILGSLNLAIQDRRIALPTGSDAMVLAFAIPLTRLEAMSESDLGTELSELLKLASWIHALKDNNPLPKLPASALMNAWLTTAAFRGPRRHWARSRGARAGAQSNKTFDPVLKPNQCGMLEGYGVMLVEWALSVIRAWPDRETMVADDNEEIRERADGLVADVVTALQLCRGQAGLLTWLRTGAADLTRTPTAERRLRARMTGNA